MTNAEDLLFNTRIRPVAPGDFGFIRSLAGKFATFTIPSEFLLWFFSHYHPDYCRVLEQAPGGLKAYLLAMPTTDPPNGIAVWQVAASDPRRPIALEYFAAYLRELVDRTGAHSISFSAPQSEATLRLIRSLAKRFFDSDVAQMHPVPTAQAEFEFKFAVRH